MLSFGIAEDVFSQFTIVHFWGRDWRVGIIMCLERGICGWMPPKASSTTTPLPHPTGPGQAPENVPGIKKKGGLRNIKKMFLEHRRNVPGINPNNVPGILNNVPGTYF